MAHISHRLGPFTGSVGPVRFNQGHAETDDPDLLDYFTGQPDLYDVQADETPDLRTDSEREADEQAAQARAELAAAAAQED